MRDGRVNIEDHLVDSNNRPMMASVSFEVRYLSPESTEGTFDSPTVSKYVHQQSLDDDQQMLLDIEQNIANLEKSFNQGTWDVNLVSVNTKRKRFSGGKKKHNSKSFHREHGFELC